MFPKKIALQYDLSCIIEKDDIPFSQKYYPLDGKWKMIFLKKICGNISFKRSEKTVFSKGASLGLDLLCIIWKDGIFFPKT